MMYELRKKSLKSMSLKFLLGKLRTFMKEHLIVKNFNRFEVILNPQLGNINWRREKLELKLINV